MADRPDERAGDPTMDSSSLYREEIVTDRKVGTIRMLTPIKSDGSADASRAVIYIGEAQLMTSVGALPINFELEAQTLDVAVSKFRRGRKRSGRAHHEGPAGTAPPAGLFHRRAARRHGRAARRRAGVRRQDPDSLGISGSRPGKFLNSIHFSSGRRDLISINTPLPGRRRIVSVRPRATPRNGG